MKQDAFSGFHPAVNFCYFAAAIGLSMFLMHPVFLAVSLSCGCAYLGYLRGGLQFYQTVWSMTGEEGITLGRCMVADDGSYHYCISLTSPEDAAVGEDYAQICASLDLSGEEDTGK